MKLFINDVNDTNKLAKIISENLKVNDYILLYGQLSSGKTTFVKMLLSHLGVLENVTSPTFIILNRYFVKGNNIKINHIDFYRLLNLDLTEELDQYIDEFDNSINLIEWPNDDITRYINKKRKIIDIKIKILNDKKRIFNITINNDEILKNILRKNFKNVEHVYRHFK